MDYVISCCTSADLSKEHFERRNIRTLCFHFELDGKEYPDDCGQSVSPQELFTRMGEGAMTHTSQVSIADYIEAWRNILGEGEDILHVCLSSGLSGTYNSACVAAKELMEEFPGRKIYVVDSRGASSGFGFLVDRLADLRDEGRSIEEVYQWAEENKLKVHHWFFSIDLKYYIRGGRISKTAGMIGQMLNICPLLNMDAAGHLIPKEKHRGKKAVMRRTVEKMKEHAQGHEDYSGKCFLSYSLYEEDAKAMAAMIEEAFPKLDGKVLLNPIGATIGSHTGPGTIAVFFWGDTRD